MRYIYYCTECGYLGSSEYDDVEITCPDCGKTLFATHIKKDDWIKKSSEEKETLKNKWGNKGIVKKKLKDANHVLVTTGDLHQEYEIIGPVYFQVSNKGLFSSALSELTRQYTSEIRDMKEKGTMSAERADWGFLYGEWSVGQNQFETAFYIATQELKKRALLVGGDAIIGMRQDIDLDSNGFSYFYLQMYGTAVKIKEKQE